MCCEPFLRHHENSLNKEAFEDLRTDPLEEGKGTFMIDNESHDLDKALE